MRLNAQFFFVIGYVLVTLSCSSHWEYKSVYKTKMDAVLKSSTRESTLSAKTLDQNYFRDSRIRC